MANSPFYTKGRYLCEVIEQAMGTATTGNPQFVMRFKVLGTPDPQNPSNYVADPNQYERTFYRTITEKTIEYFVADLEALGFHGDSFKDLEPSSRNFQSFKGQVIDMFCNHEASQDGGQREKWGIVTQRGPLDVTPIEPTKMRELDNLYGKHLKGLKKENGKAAKPQPAATVALGVTDEDVPF